MCARAAALKQYGDAVRVGEEAAKGMATVFGPNHPRTQAAQRNLQAAKVQLQQTSK